MKKKISALMIAFAICLNAVGATFAATETSKTERQTQQLAALLPASDGVITVNAQRIFSEALPQILAANQPMLKDILSKIDEVKTKTGIDLRQFEQFTIGVSNRKISATEFEFEPVVLARGTFNAAALVSLAKVALNGKYREEKSGDKTIYIFMPPQTPVKAAPQNNKTQSKNSAFEKAMDKMMEKLSREFAIASFDNNTLAIGTTARVRETLQNKVRVEQNNTGMNSEILSFINRKPNALMNFSLKMPAGMSGFINLDNDELGKNLDSIRQISGAVDIAEGSAIVSLVAKTLKPEQAQVLKETLDGLQMIGKALLGNGKGADKMVFSRMIENVRTSSSGNEVTLDLQVPQSDIDILIGVK